MKHVHADRLERWFGSAHINQISARMRDWYGPPIVMSGAPGAVYAQRGGDFVGNIDGGAFGSYLDYARDRAKRAWARWRREQYGKLNVSGFSSLADLITQSRSKRQTITFSKSVSLQVGQPSYSFWQAPSYPVSGGAAAAAPGGTVTTSSTSGAPGFLNPQVSGDGSFFVRGEVMGNRGSTTAYDAGALLLYDRLFAVAKTMSSTTTEAVTGVPTRYTNTTQGAEDSAEGNFCFPEIVAALSSTAHNWTVCQYTNQAGTTGKSFASVTGISAGSAVAEIDNSSAGGWFMPLASGDTGVKALTQMQCSASVTGTLNFVVGHPLAWMMAPQLYLPGVMDGVIGPFNMPRIFDNAALALLMTMTSSGLNMSAVDVQVDIVQG